MKTNIKAPGHSADCKGTPYFYDGLLGYEAIKCDVCGYELDLNAEANAKATAERLGQQAQHSPLPWSTVATSNMNGNKTHSVYAGERWIIEAISEANAKLIVASVNNAERLAEACKALAKLSEGWTTEQMNLAITRAQKALAAWEGTK